jgi:hypothetical protein
MYGITLADLGGKTRAAKGRKPKAVLFCWATSGIMISIEDAAGTLIQELIMEKEPGYDEWLSPAKLDPAVMVAGKRKK